MPTGVSLERAFRRVGIRLAVLLSVMLLKKSQVSSTLFVILDALFFSISLFLSAPVVQGFCRSAEISVVFPMFYAAKVLKCPRRCNLSGQGSKTPEGLK